MSRARLVFAAVSAVLLLSVLAGCGRVAQYDNGMDPVQPSGDPVLTRSPAPVTTQTSSSSPETGLVVTVGQVEAALGHRASVVTLTNRGPRPALVDGYPVVELLDAEHQPLKVDVVHGSSYMARDPGPTRVTLEPGARALSVLSWSSTVTAGDPAAGAYVELAPLPDTPIQILPLETDLGTTGQLNVTAWAVNLLN